MEEKQAKALAEAEVGCLLPYDTLLSVCQQFLEPEALRKELGPHLGRRASDVLSLLLDM